MPILYRVREQFCQLLLMLPPKAHTLLQLIGQLRVCGFAELAARGERLNSWKNKIAGTVVLDTEQRNNRRISRQNRSAAAAGYGFHTYRLRVVVMCC